MKWWCTTFVAKKNRVYFEGSTMQYERILEQLKQHNTLPEKLRAECASFSKLAMIEQGVEYVLEVKAKQKKTLTLLYDKEACGQWF
ncbi:MAG: hypothetical protein LRY68_08925 [Sulfurospirillum sp.]|nr:hypothetical protein [Sulfurospirillum sp.]